MHALLTAPMHALWLLAITLLACGEGTASPTADAQILEARPPQLSLTISKCCCNCEPLNYELKILVNRGIAPLGGLCVLKTTTFAAEDEILLEGIDLEPGTKIVAALSAHCLTFPCVSCWGKTELILEDKNTFELSMNPTPSCIITDFAITTARPCF